MAEYLKYQLKNIEPFRISDDSTSQSGQTSTLKYIPGTAIRGAVIGKLSQREDFESVKPILFSDKVRFLNAYISENGHELIPSVKGFYEDKTKVAGRKKIENVVIDGKFTDGFKRAGLGEYCYIEEETIHYYRVPTGSDLKIKINLESKSEKRNVFRNEHVTAGHTFTGYIIVDDPTVKEMICNAIDEQIIVGNARSAGLGKCKVVDKQYVSFDQTIFADYISENDLTGSCYMALYSPTAMRNKAGEYTGLNMKCMEKLLDVEDLDIEYCSTSTVEIRGYNRTLGIKLPSVPMYQQGSVFKLTFKGTLKKEKMRSLLEAGIGVKKNEGFGQVLFLSNYENVGYKLEGEKKVSSLWSESELPKDDQTLKTAAKNYYRKLLQDGIQSKIVDGMQKGNLNNSQIGKVESLIIANKYNPSGLQQILKKYFDHAVEKEDKQKVHKDRNSVKPFMKYLQNIWDTPFAQTVGVDKKTIMGIPVKELLTQDEEDKLKMQYLTEVIRHDNRKGGRA